MNRRAAAALCLRKKERASARTQAVSSVLLPLPRQRLSDDRLAGTVPPSLPGSDAVVQLDLLQLAAESI